MILKNRSSFFPARLYESLNIYTNRINAKFVAESQKRKKHRIQQEIENRDKLIVQLQQEKEALEQQVLSQQKDSKSVEEVEGEKRDHQMDEEGPDTKPTKQRISKINKKVKEDSATDVLLELIDVLSMNLKTYNLPQLKKVSFGLSQIK